MKDPTPRFLKDKFDPFSSNLWCSPSLAFERAVVRRLNSTLPPLLTSYLSRPLSQDGQNLTQQERTALKELREDRRHVYIKADKERTMCKIDNLVYIRMALTDHLLKPSYHFMGLFSSPEVRTDINRAKAVGIRIGKSLSKQLLKQTRKEVLLALPKSKDEFTLPGFRLLLKTHKNPVTTRPIAGASNWITTKVSKWLSGRLQPLVKKIPWRLENTDDLKDRLSNCKLRFANKGFDRIPSSYKKTHHLRLGTADVTAMYPSIPLEEGMESFEEFLTLCSLPQCVVALYVSLMRWILTSLFVRLGPWVFAQVKGTAMGTNVAPEYANIVLFIAEWKAFYSHMEDPFDPLPIPFNYCVDLEDPFEPILTIVLYLRYIDDIFLMIIESILDPVEFEDKVKCIKSIVRFSELEFSAISFANTIDFLDMSITVNAETWAISHAIYIKPTNTHLHLPPSSQHGPSVKTAWPVAEFRRILSLCSSDTIAKPFLLNFMRTLAARDFPQHLILSCFNKAVRPKPDFIPRNAGRTFVPIRTNRQTAGLMLPKAVEVALIEFPEFAAAVRSENITPAWTQAPSLESILKPRQSRLEEFARALLPDSVLQSPSQLVQFLN